MKIGKAIIAFDLTFGDAGKGSIVDYLARRDGAVGVVRFNGGAQAAHNVITPEGVQHTFAQFGSATFVPGVKTYLSRFMLVNPFFLFAEADELIALGVTDAFERLYVDADCVITTPFHWAMNRLREMARGAGRHGSCGKGIGETMIDWLNLGEKMLFARDFSDEAVCREKLTFLQARNRAKLDLIHDLIPATPEAARELDLLESPEVIELSMKYLSKFVAQVKIIHSDELAAWLEKGTVIFEGAQGVLLDEWYGFHPHTTWSTTTPQNALTILKEIGYTGEVERLGIIRAYATRHGAGPFVVHDEAMTAAIPELHNKTDDWQGEFRVGPLDFVALRYALEVSGGVDALAVTCLDRLPASDRVPVCERYSTDSILADKFFALDWHGQVRTLRVKDELENLVYQENLTRELTQCRPVVRSVQKTELISVIERELGAPVEIISFGVSATDKQTIQAASHRAAA